jgi:hypothetical protein
MMARILRTGLAVTAVAVVAIVGMGASGCSDIHKASVAADSIGASLQAAETVNRQLAMSEFETVGERQAIAAEVEAAAKANDQFVATLKAVSAAGGQPTSAQVAAGLNAVAASISVLEGDGVLKLKSPDARAQFATIMGAINVQLAILKAVVTAHTSSNAAPGERSGPSGAMAAGLALSATEIEELIALATAAGSALVGKLTAMKGEADSQLQADALSEDAAAEKQAEADEASS